MKRTAMHKALCALFLPAAIGAAEATFASDDSGRYRDEAARAGEKSQAQRTIRADDIIGRDVTDLAGRDIGEVQDLIVNLSSGDVRHAIVSLQGTGDMRERLVAVPVRDLRRDRHQDKLVLQTPVNRVKQLRTWQPRGNDRDWPDITYWNGDDRDSLSQRFYSYRASRLIGQDVESPGGENLGELQDLVVDLRAQKLRYAVIEFDPGILSRERLHAVPLPDFLLAGADMNRRGEPEKLVVNITKSDLKRMRGFDDEDWPDFDDRRDTAAIDTQFDYRGSSAATGAGADDSRSRKR